MIWDLHDRCGARKGPSEFPTPNLTSDNWQLTTTQSRRILQRPANVFLNPMYHLIGKQVLVHLYSHQGISVGTVRGRVADVAAAVEVAPGMKKDLAYVVDITTDDPETPYKNSAGGENESWFAIQDIEVIEDDKPRLFVN